MFIFKILDHYLFSYTNTVETVYNDTVCNDILGVMTLD